MTKEASQCVCQKEIEDIFEVPVVFNFGKFKGQCIDSCRNRPGKIIKFENSHSLEVANILHYGSFYRASIDLNKVQNIFVGFEEFLPGIFHVFLKFDFESEGGDLTLLDQAAKAPFPKKNVSFSNDKNLSKLPLKMNSLVISPEGISSKGNSYNLLESLLGHYVLVYRVLTNFEMFRQAESKHNKIRIYKLSLDKSQASKVLKEALLRTDTVKLDNIYHLFKNNCATTAFSLIESGVGPLVQSQNSLVKFQLALPVMGPIGTYHVMNQFHLLK